MKLVATFSGSYVKTKNKQKKEDNEQNLLK